MTNMSIISVKPVAFTTALPTIEQQSLSPEAAGEKRLQAALEHARRITQMYGYQSVDVANLSAEAMTADGIER